MTKVFTWILTQVQEIILGKIFIYFNNNSFFRWTFLKKLNINNHKVLQLKRKRIKSLFKKTIKLIIKIILQTLYYMKVLINLWMKLIINLQLVYLGMQQWQSLKWILTVMTTKSKSMHIISIIIWNCIETILHKHKSVWTTKVNLKWLKSELTNPQLWKRKED